MFDRSIIIISIAAYNNIEGSLVECKVADMDGMDLSDGGNR